MRCVVVSCSSASSAARSVFTPLGGCKRPPRPAFRRGSGRCCIASHFNQNGIDAGSLGRQHGPFGRIIVPLHQGRDWGDARDDLGIKRLEGVGRHDTVAVDQQRPRKEILGMAAFRTDLTHYLHRKILHVQTRITARGWAGRRAVVHVQKQIAAGAPGIGGQELGLAMVDCSNWMQVAGFFSRIRRPKASCPWSTCVQMQSSA